MASEFLTENQKKFLETIIAEGDIEPQELKSELKRRGVGKGYRDRPDKLENEVIEHVEQLPERIESLFEDIDLLYEAGYLNTEAGAKACMALLSIEATDDDKFTDQFRYTTESGLPGESAPVDFGREFGEASRKLSFSPRAMEPDEVQAELVWGFIQGISNYSPQFAVDCTERLGERAKTEAQAVADGQEAVRNTLEHLGTLINQEYEQIEEMLKNQGIRPDECLPGAILAEIKRDYDIHDPKITPLTTVDEIDAVEDVITAERVQEIVEDHRLVEKRHLIDLMAQSFQQIKDVDAWGGIDVGTIFQAVPTDRSATSREIAEEVASTKRLPAIVKIGRYLAGETDLHDTVWEGPPLLYVKDTESFGQEEWTLRSFGRALQHYPPLSVGPPLYRPSMFTDTEIHAHLEYIPDNVIDNALDNLKTDRG